MRDVQLGEALHNSTYGADEFEIWYTERFGWIVPTLLIRNPASRESLRGFQRRSYAVALKDGALVRAGMGPHVLKTKKVYLSEGNVQRLRPVIARIHEGASAANIRRDEISTRMATGRSRRTSWGF